MSGIISDEDLIDKIRGGNKDSQDILIEKYKPLVKIKARTYFLTGADRDDLVQEGMIGLFRAIRDYERGKQSSFYSFADLCITRQIFTAIKTATRKKHSPLNSYISLYNSYSDNANDISFDDISYLTGKSGNPESILIEREDRSSIEKRLNQSLSSFETDVLRLYLLGKSYSDIAVETGKHAKSVDNAIQRIKRKLEKLVKAR